jgi:hypothetical protein
VTGGESQVTSRGLASDWKGIAGDWRGIAGDSIGIAGDSIGIAGDSIGIAGDSIGIAGDSSGLAGDDRYSFRPYQGEGTCLIEDDVTKPSAAALSEGHGATRTSLEIDQW